jgi:hypothetical protein
MLTVIESDDFIAWAAKVWTDEEREAFIDWIAENPDAGDVIRGSGGLRKVRWKREGMGKSSGARAIYYVRNQQGQIVLLLVYSKAKFDNISTAVLKALKAKMEKHHDKDQRPGNR